MSAPSPVHVPERVPPSVAPGPSRQRPLWKLLVAALLLAALGIGAYLALKARSARKAAPAVVIPTVTVRTGTLVRTLRLSGQTSARTFANITAPRLRGPDTRGMQLIYLAKSGSIVKKGDVVAKMDTQSQQDHIDDVEDLVETAENDVLKRRAQQAIEWGDLEQSLRSAKASLDAAKQDARAAEVRTAIERELLQLSVSENEANYAQLQKDIPVKRAEHEAEIRLLEITLQRQRNHLERHQSDIKKMVMYAPMAGLVVMQSIFRSGEFTQISVGDQVSPGQPFMKIVQTDSMQVEADVNQARASEFRIGQTARIGFDAFPGLYEKGRIYSIGAMAIGSWRTNAYIRNIPVRISIQGSDPRVIPDLSAYADVQVGKADNAVLAPLQAVQMDNGKPVVFVKQGEGFEKRPVQLGLSNAIQVAVLSGLSAGEVIALQKPN